MKLHVRIEYEPDYKAFLVAVCDNRSGKVLFVNKSEPCVWFLSEALESGFLPRLREIWKDVEVLKQHFERVEEI